VGESFITYLNEANEARENGQEQGEVKEGEVSPELLIKDCGPSS
jgi:hypothetical protein